jgi:hypothetical protein
VNKADLELFANALLAAVRAGTGGGPVGLFTRDVAAGAGEPVTVTGSRVYVVSSAFKDGAAGFAPFTLKTDTGREVVINRPFTQLSLGKYMGLTLKNTNAGPGGNAPYDASFAGNPGSVAAVVDIPMMVTGGGAGAAVSEITCEIPFVCSPSNTILWGVLVADAPYAPAAQEKFAVFLWADRY